MILLYHNTPIYYEIRGKGPVIVLLHGFLACLKIWEQLIPEIANNKTILSIDLPGHGKSGTIGDIHSMELMAEVVHSILEKHHIKSATFIGHSMGGYVALAFTELYEKEVDKLFLLNSTPVGDSSERKLNRDRALKIISMHPRAFISIAISSWFNIKTQGQYTSEILEISNEALKFSVEGLKASIVGMKNRKDQTITLKKFSGEKYMICGMQDPIISINDSVLVAFQTETKIKIVAGGHLSIVENFEEIVKFFHLTLF